MQGMTNKQLHKVNSAMMRNDKVDAQVVIKLSNISNEVHVSPGSQSVMRRWEYKSINDECTTSLSWVSSSRTQSDAGGAPGRSATQGADYVKTRSSCLRS